MSQPTVRVKLGIPQSGREAAPLADKTIEALMPYKQHLKTITADNGKEFAKHELIACGLGINF